MRENLKQLAAMFKQGRVTAPIVIVLVITASAFSEVFWFKNSYMLFYLAMPAWVLWQLRQRTVRNKITASTSMYGMVKKLRDLNQLRILYLSPIESNHWSINMLHKIRNQYMLSLYVTADHSDLANLAAEIIDSDVQFIVSAKDFFTLKLKGMIETESEEIANEALEFLGYNMRLPT